MSTPKKHAVVVLVLSLGLSIAPPATARSTGHAARSADRPGREVAVERVAEGGSLALLELIGDWWSRLWVASRSTVGGDG